MKKLLPLTSLVAPPSPPIYCDVWAVGLLAQVFALFYDTMVPMQKCAFFCRESSQLGSIISYAPHWYEFEIISDFGIIFSMHAKTELFFSLQAFALVRLAQ